MTSALLLAPQILLPFLVFIILFHALVLSLSGPRSLLFLAAFLDSYILYSLFHSRVSDGPFLWNWLMGMTLFGTVVGCFNLACLRGHGGFERSERVQRKESGREKGKGNGKREEMRDKYVFDRKRRSFSERIWDAVDVIVSVRGVGWKWEVRNLPHPLYLETISTSRFVMGNILGIIWRMLMIECWRIYLLERSITMGERDMHHGPWWYRVLIGAVCIFQAQITIELPHLAASTLGVMVGYGKPSDWPPIFDSVMNAWSVRRFWSRHWHQILRGIAEPPVEFVLQGLFKLPKESYISSCGKILGNFYVAYLMHGIPKVVAGGDKTSEWNFFMGQAVVICLEAVVSQIACTLRFPDSRQANRFVGYVWTFMFQSWAWLHYNDAVYLAVDLTVPIFGFCFVEPILELVGLHQIQR